LQPPLNLNNHHKYNGSYTFKPFGVQYLVFQFHTARSALSLSTLAFSVLMPALHTSITIRRLVSSLMMAFCLGPMSISRTTSFGR